MEGKLTYTRNPPVVLVTGATSGIGRATAMELAARGTTVLIHGRDPARCDGTVAAIRDATGNSSVEPIIADLASLADVRRLAAEVEARHPGLDILVNNAGVGPATGSRRSRKVSRPAGSSGRSASASAPKAMPARRAVPARRLAVRLPAARCLDRSWTVPR